ncbi:MAG: DUF547 domain-containing protein [Candidatus Eisenbacteria bacterium]|uniref:DUF547 domain-containing protein n=1 Tax=Eiseniibacteriota bacterium TaxID=2212470 RepID=A0A7Y2E814_UNCEI|nr:DUF547 domain-containing protein [Candidatus Eisenbacteria bacterium]
MSEAMKYFSIFLILTVASLAAPAVSLATESPMAAESSADDAVTADAAEFSHEAWDALLKRHVNDGHVDYEGFLADRKALQVYLDALAKADPYDWTRNEQMAFWINAYNAVMIDAVLEAWPTEGVLKIGRLLGFIPTAGVFRQKHQVAGTERSLDDIEHRILRPRYEDARIHAAINCASVSCPKLQSFAFTAKALDEQLDAAMIEFVNDPARNQLFSRPPKLSRIFKWFREDFEREGDVWSYVTEWVDPASRQKIDPQAKPKFLKYNWDLND